MWRKWWTKENLEERKFIKLYIHIHTTSIYFLKKFVRRNKNSCFQSSKYMGHLRWDPKVTNRMNNIILRMNKIKKANFDECIMPSAFFFSLLNLILAEIYKKICNAVKHNHFHIYEYFLNSNFFILK